eukprot:gb/GECG01003882.1/.p1 GENE.gb/GECG01003882.1/~~gb/GECG01003882.1/.p1  ORF type:complete len:596 (+),score=126.87 gb/GECG01003882.1/:1-1788(+)
MLIKSGPEGLEDNTWDQLLRMKRRKERRNKKINLPRERQHGSPDQPLNQQHTSSTSRWEERKKNESVARSFGFSKASSSAQKHDTSETIAARRAKEDQEQREKQLQDTLNHQFKAKPVPATTTQPLFTKVMKRKEMTAKYRVEARRKELEEMMKPFKGLMQHEEDMSADLDAKRRQKIRDEEQSLRESRRFRANPLPSSVQKDAQEQLKEEMAEREKVRREKVAERAASTLASAAYPPRMEMHIKREQQEGESGAKRASAPEYSYQPQVNHHLPNFSKLHQRFSEQLAQSRKTLSRTTPQPFSFDTEKKREEEREKREARRQARLTSALDLMSSKGTAGESWLKEEQAQHRQDSTALQSQHEGQDTGSKSRTVRRASAKDVLRGGWMDPPSGPTPSLTRSVELQMRHRQAELRAKQLDEQSAAMEEEIRRSKELEASRKIKPIVTELEKQRRPQPLAWQVDGSHPVARERKREADRQLQERYNRNQERIQRAQETRPPLFLRGTIEHAKNTARQQALQEIAENASASQENKRAWQDLAAEYSTRSTSQNEDYESPTSSQVNQLRAYAMANDLEDSPPTISNVQSHSRERNESNET